MGKKNSNKTLYDACPDIEKIWNFSKNNNLSPKDIPFNSAQRIWLQCLIEPKNHDAWEARVSNIIISLQRKSKSYGCPSCRGLKVNLNNSIASIPRLKKEFHPTKNNNMLPNNIHYGSHQRLWWICNKCMHEWNASSKQRYIGNNCPACRGSIITPTNNFASHYPNLALELHPTKNINCSAETLHKGSRKTVWWLCTKCNNEWQAAIYNRINGSGCPYCNSGWTTTNIKRYIADILQYLDTFTPAELYVLFQQQQGLLESRGKGHALIKALLTNKFPKDDFEKFINNESSILDEYLSNELLDVENLDNSFDNRNIEYQQNINEMPTIQTKEILNTLDNPIIANSDAEAIEFFIKSALAKIWNHAFLDENQALNQLKQYKGDGPFVQSVQKEWINEYKEAKQLSIPIGYSGEHTPNLMQRYVAYLIKTHKRIGNWSGTGAGKTLSAILASRVINARLTIICCPNNVVSTWLTHIKSNYPDSSVFIKKLPMLNELNNINHSYIILNYDFFQNNKTISKLIDFSLHNNIDFIVLDEIHYAKQRFVLQESKRKNYLSAFLSEVGLRNQNLHVLGMSATPVINNLLEGKVIMEMITGLSHDELQIQATISNCITLYKKFVSYGIRYIPKYNLKLNETLINIDCTNLLPEIKKHKTYVELEAILTQNKIPYILQNLQPRTIVYTHYRDGIDIDLQKAILNAGWKVGFFNGTNKDGLNDFKQGIVDILIATSCIGTGVDGLQELCNRLIINCLPWTYAEYQQLIGRIYRQGQSKSNVDVIILLTHAFINGERWSWCESRWNLIKSKKTVADAAVDGVIPEEQIRTKSQVHKDAMKLLERLEKGETHNIVRHKIISSFNNQNITISPKKNSDFGSLNKQINNANSEKTYKRFLNNPKEWHEYHNMYRDARKEWPIIPYQEAIDWLQPRPHWIVGDFGCGEALIAKQLKNTVHSFDYIAINEKVIACDIKNVPLPNNTLDAAIFSLSLMGLNYLDYIKEAHRCLKLDGYIWISEPSKRIKNINLFIDLLYKLGFDMVGIAENKWKFTFIKAIKTGRTINEAGLNNLLENKILS